jgi:hypothetical protein
MTAKNKQGKKKMDRWEKLDWLVTFGEILWYVPRLFGRLFRRWFDW